VRKHPKSPIFLATSTDMSSQAPVLRTGLSKSREFEPRSCHELFLFGILDIAHVVEWLKLLCGSLDRLRKARKSVEALVECLTNITPP
jgi:hypothetical protein